MSLVGRREVRLGADVIAKSIDAEGRVQGIGHIRVLQLGEPGVGDVHPLVDAEGEGSSSKDSALTLRGLPRRPAPATNGSFRTR